MLHGAQSLPLRPPPRATVGAIFTPHLCPPRPLQAQQSGDASGFLGPCALAFPPPSPPFPLCVVDYSLTLCNVCDWFLRPFHHSPSLPDPIGGAGSRKKKESVVACGSGCASESDNSLSMLLRGQAVPGVHSCPFPALTVTHVCSGSTCAALSRAMLCHVWCLHFRFCQNGQYEQASKIWV